MDRVDELIENELLTRIGLFVPLHPVLMGTRTGAKGRKPYWDVDGVYIGEWEDYFPEESAPDRTDTKQVSLEAWQ